MGTTHQSDRDKGLGRLSSLMKQAESLAEEGLFEEAIAHTKKAIAIYPHEPKCCIQLAKFYHAQNKMGPAIEAIKAAVGLDPNNSMNQEHLLKALLQLERYDEVIKHAREMLLTFPRSLLARDALGTAYLQTGKLDCALGVVEELIALAPREASHYFKKGVLLQQKGKIREAMRSFMMSLELDPGGELANNAREAIASLDSFQLKRILGIASEDVVFRVKLMRNPASATMERGFALSPQGIAALRQLDYSWLPTENGTNSYH